MNLTYLTILITGICWTITYIALIYRGFKDKAYGMPLAAIVLNFAWEFTFSLIYADNTNFMFRLINITWMVCDIGIIITFYKYGYKYFKKQYNLSKNVFYVSSLLGFFLSFCIMLTGGPFFKGFSHYFNNDIFQGAIFIAFIQNAIMSVLFVQFFYSRKAMGYNIEGQSFYIALFKFIGASISAGASTYLMHHNNFYFIGSFVLICFIFDLWYLVLVYKELQHNNINPLKRF